MVARLEADGVLRDPAVRSALLEVRREELLPSAYVRRNPPGEQPGVWQLLDGAHPDDRAEWLGVLYGGASVRVQHDGESLFGRARGMVTGGRITGVTSVVAMVVDTLQSLRLQRGLSYLELGTGAGIAAALVCHIVGADAVTTVESDAHLADAARSGLAALGYRPHVVVADGRGGCPGRAPYDRIAATFAVPYLPVAWLDQLADDGLLLATVTTTSPSWPAQAVVRRRGGRINATLVGQSSGHRPIHGYEWMSTHGLRVGAPPGCSRASTVAPPGMQEYGFWLALSHLVPGLLRDFTAEHLTLFAPLEESWIVARPDSTGGNTVIDCGGPRDIWTEVEDVHARWVRAGRPHEYRIEVAADGSQHITAGTVTHRLEWQLPAPPAPGPSAGTR